MTEFKVEVRGLRELAGAYRHVNAELPKVLKVSMLGIAQRVADVAVQRMPYLSGRAARSVKPRATAQGAAVAWGGQAAPYLPWLDFGGTTGRGHQPGQRYTGSVVRVWQGRDVQTPAGRYIYPAVSEAQPATMEAVDKAVKHVAESAGFETRGGL